MSDCGDQNPIIPKSNSKYIPPESLDLDMVKPLELLKNIEECITSLKYLCDKSKII